MNAKPILVASLIASGLGGGSYLVFSQPNTAPAAHVAVALDVSDSMENADAEQRVRGLVVRALKVDGLRSGSRLLVIATGNPATALEPVGIADLEIPVTKRVMDGTGAIEIKRRELVADVLERYKKTATEMRTSPLFLALKRGLAQLRAAGCDDKRSCTLFFGTDGEETEEPWIKNSLRRGKVLSHGAPAPLDNSGIKVVICGLSETKGQMVGAGKRRLFTGKRSDASTELLSAVWSKVFTEPDTVVFEPFCPKAVAN